MRSFQVPVIVTVDVIVDDEGNAHVEGAYTDVEGAPWPYSDAPTAYELEHDGEEVLEWHEGRADEDEPYVIAWNAAYDQLRVSFGGGVSSDGNGS